MPFNNYMMNPMGQMPQVNQMMPQMARMQPIQSFEIQQQFSCFTVKNENDLANVNVMPNSVYIGLNSDLKEVYIRKMNNDGKIEVESYVLKSAQKEKTEVQAILERLDSIEQKISQRPVLTMGKRDEQRVSKLSNE